MPDSDHLLTIAQACGVTLEAFQIEQLLRFRDFLGSEGIEAGGIGPNEADRLIDRHIGDSLAYLLGIGETPGSVLDVGSGLGLPGIPLAVARPDASVVLLDRSQRKSDLARRAVQMLELENVEIRTEEAGQVTERWGAVTFRASLPVTDAAAAVSKLLKPSGTGVLGLSRRCEAPELGNPPAGISFEVTCELEGVLDSPFWLLRMTPI